MNESTESPMERPILIVVGSLFILTICFLIYARSCCATRGWWRSLTGVPPVETRQERRVSDGELTLNLPLDRDRVKHRNWKFVKAVGQGAFGSVHLAINNKNNKYFAVKRMFLGSTDKKPGVPTVSLQKKLQKFQNEVDILADLDHDHIVRYLGHSASSTCEVFIYMEFVGAGSLRSLMKFMDGPLGFKTCVRYLMQIVSGLAYLHHHSVVHRDLKPANVLVGLDGDVKIADFGTAKDLALLTHTPTSGQTLCGTAAYIAPEVAARGKHTTASDVFSLGCMAFKMATNILPFRSTANLKPSARDTILARRMGDETFKWPDWVSVPLALKAFVEVCIVRNPTRRPTTHALLNDPHALFLTQSREIQDYLDAMHSSLSRLSVVATPREVTLTVGDSTAS